MVSLAGKYKLLLWQEVEAHAWAALQAADPLPKGSRAREECQGGLWACGAEQEGGYWGISKARRGHKYVASFPLWKWVLQRRVPWATLYGYWSLCLLTALQLCP